jgi:hypothetical protein
MHRLRRLVPCLTLIALSSSLALAGSVPFGVHADAKWFAHVDLDALKQTTVGAKMMDHLQQGQADNKLAALSSVFNFDPRSDLNDLVLYGFGNDRDGAVVVRGKFDPERLVTLVKAGEDYAGETYEGHQLHSWTDPKKCGTHKRAHGVVHAPDIIVFADDLSVLKKAVDVLDRRAPIMIDTARFPGLNDSPRGGFIFAAANMAEMIGLTPQAQTFKAVESGVMTIGEADGLIYADLVLEAANADAATMMKRVLDGMAGLALLNREKNPAGARLAEKSESTVEGSRLTLTLWSPVADVIAHIEAKHQRKMHQRK